jgi:hypothetical protein
MESNIILSENLIGRTIELIRPCGNFAEMFPVGTKGKVSSISESGAIWMEGVGWIRQEWAVVIN